ncbi:MAG: peptidylprolyl isomerase [Muribaculaceae bacterium]
MKKGLLSLALVLASVAVVQAKGSKDPELMTINGKAVTLGEFEYLYHKNNSQQLAPQTIDEYLDMFVTYKQKVADAESEGIDNTEAFKNEFDGYRRELAEPYLRNKEMEDSIIRAVYSHMQEDVDVSHIMLASKGPGIDADAQKHTLDSIRTAILNGADFAALARQYSIDRAARKNGGRMGFIPVGRLPYTFEDAAYNTKAGEISPVVETPFGFHIVKVNARRPARGQVLAQHILKLTQGLSEEDAAKKKAEIDSIGALLAAGADFEEIAKKESEDPGSQRNGGRLNWFGAGQMVPEFEEAAFSLQNGEVSAPFKTSYGYHIVKRLDWKPVDSFETMEPMIKNVIQRDERGQMPRKRKIAELRRKFKAGVNAANLALVKNEIVKNGGLDSALIEKYIVSEMEVASMGKQKILLSEVVSEIGAPLAGTPERQAAQFEERVNLSLDNAVTEAERQDLAVNNADYRNLLNEYRDGMLLFEVSDRKVWTKAKQDKEGLENYFRTHRDKYKWEKPKFKSYVVFATSDSIMQLAKGYLESTDMPGDSLATDLRKKFGKDVKIEKVIAAQGENNITDYLGFGAEKPEAKGKWAWYFPYRGKILNAPEEAADVRGAVTGDYQGELEEAWVAGLKQKFPAKINKKTLKKAK